MKEGAVTSEALDEKGTNSGVPTWSPDSPSSKAFDVQEALGDPPGLRICGVLFMLLLLLLLLILEMRPSFCRLFGVGR